MQKIKRAAVAQVQCFNSVVQRCTVVHSVETVLKQSCTIAEEGGISDVKDQMEKKSAKRGGRAALLDHGILSALSGTHAVEVPRKLDNIYRQQCCFTLNIVM